MDATEGLDRSPVDKREDYYASRGDGQDVKEAEPALPTGPAASRRSRSRSPGGGAAGTATARRSRSPADRRTARRSSRSPKREERERRRGDSPGAPRFSRPEDDRYPHSSTRGGHSSFSSRSYAPRGVGRYSDYPPRRTSAREHVAQEAIKTSKKENRVYVNNLSFHVRWHDLKDFCSSVGTVVFAEIIQLPNGMSKGCGVVEYSTHEEAQRAIRELNEKHLMGRPAFLREDRENEARYGSAAVSGRTSFPGAALVTGGSHYSPAPLPSSRGAPSVPPAFAPPGPRGLFVTGMSPNIGWQDLKDLFRAAGNVVRADINMDHTTGQSKGTGVVVMDSKAEANAAIAMFNGYEFDGGRLEVREDRFYHINAARGAHGGLRVRGGSVGGFSSRGSYPPYGDYPGYPGGPDMSDYGYGPTDYAGSRGGYSSRGVFSGGRGGFRGGRPAAPAIDRTQEVIPAAPSVQIFVKNLPWSTANEDLVELFQTTGTVQHAEVLWENGRSKGSGVVQFATVEEAETAMTKFQGYQYGGRPLAIGFNARWKDFGASSQSQDQSASNMDTTAAAPAAEYDVTANNGGDPQEVSINGAAATEQADGMEGTATDAAPAASTAAAATAPADVEQVMESAA